MINLNSVNLVGRLTKDIELKKAGESSVANFTLAIDRQFGGQGEKQADFINCIAWKQAADFLAKYAKKGTVVCVNGRIQTRSYDGKDGKVYVTEVVANNVQIMATGNGNGGNTEAKPAEQPQQEYPAVTDQPIGDIGDDELPF